MKYRKKPVVVEAVQFRQDATREVLDFIGNITGCYFSTEGLLIPTLEGVMLAVEGDYIIKGIMGELYSCKPDIFEMSYERVEDV